MATGWRSTSQCPVDVQCVMSIAGWVTTANGKEASCASWTMSGNKQHIQPWAHLGAKVKARGDDTALVQATDKLDLQNLSQSLPLAHATFCAKRCLPQSSGSGGRPRSRTLQCSLSRTRITVCRSMQYAHSSTRATDDRPHMTDRPHMIKTTQ